MCVYVCVFVYSINLLYAYFKYLEGFGYTIKALGHSSTMKSFVLYVPNGLTLRKRNIVPRPLKFS